ncbi:MAG: hypothetical protein OHK0017_08240 [Patescibacteria group bacterium]
MALLDILDQANRIADGIWGLPKLNRTTLGDFVTLLIWYILILFLIGNFSSLIYQNLIGLK